MSYNVYLNKICSFWERKSCCSTRLSQKAFGSWVMIVDFAFFMDFVVSTSNPYYFTIRCSFRMDGDEIQLFSRKILTNELKKFYKFSIIFVFLLNLWNYANKKTPLGLFTRDNLLGVKKKAEKIELHNYKILQFPIPTCEQRNMMGEERKSHKNVRESPKNYESHMWNDLLTPNKL